MSIPLICSDHSKHTPDRHRLYKKRLAEAGICFLRSVTFCRINRQEPARWERSAFAGTKTAARTANFALDFAEFAPVGKRFDIAKSDFEQNRFDWNTEEPNRYFADTAASADTANFVLFPNSAD